MILQRRQPDRRRFKSSIRYTAKRKREYFYSSITILLVKIILLGFLFVLLKTSIVVFFAKFKENSQYMRYSLPLLVLIMIVALIYYIIKNIKGLREEYKNLHE